MTGNEIKENIENPGQLEKFYQADKKGFKNALPAICRYMCCGQ